MIVMVAAGTVIFKAVSLMFAKMVYDYDIELLAVMYHTAKEVIYNVIITFIIFKPLTLLAEIINKSKDTYYLL